MTITVEDLKGLRLRHQAHLDGPRGPKGWFGDVRQCIEHPRLSRFDKCHRATRKVEVIWQVDWQPCASLEEAVAKLNEAPVLTDAEKAALERVTDDWQDLRKGGGINDLIMLGYKGLIEWEDGKCRRRKNGDN